MLTEIVVPEVTVPVLTITMSIIVGGSPPAPGTIFAWKTHKLPPAGIPVLAKVTGLNTPPVTPANSPIVVGEATPSQVAASVTTMCP